MDRPPDPPPPPKVEAATSASTKNAPASADGSTASKLPPRADGSSSTGGNAKRRRKRGNKAPGRNRTGNRKRGGGGGGGGPSVLQLPQLKFTIRNIGDVERHGTAAQVLDMVRDILQAVNEDGTSGMPICLDEESVRRVVRAEELVAAAAAEAAEKVAAAEQGGEQKIETEKEDKTEKDEGKEEKEEDKFDKPKEKAVTKDNVRMEKDDKPSGPAYSTVASASLEKTQEETKPENAISARVLYVVPPKRSRRRGQKNGCAYLVLSTPPLPKQPAQLETIMSPADRSRAVAKARLELLQALDAISQKAKADARASQKFAGCTVEQSMNVKTWKERERSHRDRREGTIEQTADYKRFVTNMEKAEQDRLNRPKPAPGGGAIVADATDESGQPVAALVLHLRAKKEEQRARRKRASGRKKTDPQEKVASTRKKKSSRGEAPSNKPAKSTNRREKQKSRKKKGSKNKGSGAATVTPTLLKHGNGALANGDRNGKG